MSQPACFGAKSAQKTIIEAQNGPLTDAASKEFEPLGLCNVKLT
jgi:hypothetical protein